MAEYDDPNQPAPLVPGQGAPADTQPPAQQTSALADQWRGWMGDPHNRAALIQFGLALSQPISAGQNIGGHIGQAIGQAGEASDRVTAEEQRATELASKQDLREAQAGAAEARAGAAGARAGAAGDRLTFMRERLSADQEARTLRANVQLRGLHDKYIKMMQDTNKARDLQQLPPLPILPFEDYIAQTPGLAPLAGPGGAGAGGGSLVDKARQAIQRGADPAAVKQRLIEQGGNPDEL